MNGSIVSDGHSNAVSISGADTTSVMVPNLVASAEYMFNVTAGNSVGSSSIICGPILHVIGKTKTDSESKLYFEFTIKVVLPHQFLVISCLVQVLDKSP